MKIFQALMLAAVAVLQVDADTCATWGNTCSDDSASASTATGNCTSATCTEDECCLCPDGYIDSDNSTDIVTCVIDDTKCLSHTCTVTDEVQIQDAATTDCTGGTCTDEQCCEADACSVTDACGENQDCATADDNTATCTCTDGYVDANADGDATTVVCDLDDTKCLSHTCTEDGDIHISAAATTDCAVSGCTNDDCCMADPCAVDDVCGDYQDCTVADDDTASCTCMDGYVDDGDDNAATLTCELDDDGGGDEDVCSTEAAACEANTACAACMTAGDAYMEDGSCVVESEPETCQDFADMYCCFAGGEDGEDECRTNSLILAYTNCLIEENEVESCTLVDLCDTSATVAPTPAPVTSGTSSFFSRSSPGAAVFGAVATGIVGFLFTAAEGLL